ncbi:C40 family peptidase [Vogesella sp. XCS3]|uniref:C40 family peptidase n=1 Tax=Vogesella sp. XCS3 TaxID=2877939 RepID=UPI001D0B8D54|nr:C40 family peptidase [Vogesella sp. XCS3]UDM17395.1 C40 family peptidase [Vogesella sp. XCS3]
MKFYQSILALFLAGFMAVAHAAPDTAADGEADPIARFASPGEEAAGDLLLQAMSLIGVAYRFGGSNPESGLDCSGFIQYVFKKSLRVNLPRTSASMAQVGREIDRDELKAGDLVFFNTRGFRYSHVGMYLGNNKFIHSPRTGKSIEVVNMTQSYWATRYNGARRVARAGMPVAAAEVEKPASNVAAASTGKRSYRKVEAADTEQRSVKGKKKKNARDDAPVAKGKKGKKAEQGSSARSKKKAGAEQAVSKKSSKKSSKSSDGAKKKAPVKKKKD